MHSIEVANHNMIDSETVCQANDHSSACWKPSQLSLERKGLTPQISHDVISADEANWLVSERKAAEIRVCLLGEISCIAECCSPAKKRWNSTTVHWGEIRLWMLLQHLRPLFITWWGPNTLPHRIWTEKEHTIGITKQTYMIQSAESQSFPCRLSYAPGNVGLCTFLVESVEGQQSPPSYWQ